MNPKSWRSRAIAIIIAFIIAITTFFGSTSYTAAQSGDPYNQPAGGMTIHIVQRGENLFRIAMQYGTTVDAISAANGITDPRTIAVGQRLLIPNAQVDATGAQVAHVVQPGDTLDTLTRLYQTSAADLAADNAITNPAQLYVGQPLTIRQGTVTADASESGVPYRVAPGENLYRIALDRGITLNTLLEANDLTLPAAVFPGQRLWIPGSSASAVVADLPLPFAALSVLPTPPVQGQTVEIHVTTTGSGTVSGTFLGDPLTIMAQDATNFYALVGIDRFTTPGIYALVLSAAADGTQSTLTLRVKIDSGGYSSESIVLEPALMDLLNPTITEPEWQRLVQVTSAYTSQRNFSGVMGLPSSGAITSQYGTQRDYNSGALNTFHSGTDFGGAPGSPIVAPAAGIVMLAELLTVRGNATIIDHGWGIYTGYWHQSEIFVKPGDVVAAGQVIGTIGSTGRVTGPHLHWELWVSGVQVDPMQWVRQSFP
ncbi:LysM peptidoglycan-binding domain-containing M23 family metallopeptidase [Aggregatilinea lenta]|uniref:LysM peptidoglycan-binding domain-containing M23 family metallopeptidase n=1 Tax=Aggregatilinea lenta TaxID=913108 RepID=UPI000E5BE57C|nr:LysM peptidoglycan-binding domain-containing protein [Aggregatilinea lenta]